MKKLIILFISLMVGLLLISGCVPKEEEIKQKQERKIVINNLFTNMIENKDSAFLDVEKYSGMDENKKYLLGNEIACYSYQYMKYSIDKEEKIDEDNYKYVIKITAIDFEEVKKNYPENESRNNKLIKQAIDAAKNKPKTSKVEIKVYLNDFSGNYKIQIDEDFFDAVLPNYQTFLDSFK